MNQPVCGVIRSPCRWLSWISCSSWVLSFSHGEGPWCVRCLKIFWCGSFLKSIKLVTILLLFYILVFRPGSLWNLCSPTRLNLQPPVLEGEVLTTGPPGKSLFYLNFFLLCGFDYRDWLTIKNIRFVSVPWFPGSRSHWTQGWLEQGLLPRGLALGAHALGAHPLRGISCTVLWALVCLHVTCWLRISSPPHAEHSGRSPASHLLAQSQNGLQDSKTIRLFLFFFSALSSLFSISTESLTFFFSFFFSSPGFCSKDSGILGTGPVYKDPSPFFSFLHYCLSVLHQKKKPMCQVSENRSLTAEGEKERHWQTKQ